MKLLEMSSKNDKDGRRKVKVILHEIYEDNSKYNKNGITWLEEYCERNLESIKGTSITCEFINEDRTEILGHGETGLCDGVPIFENATMIGVLEKGYIDDIEVDGETKRACIGEGFLDAMRYKNFIDLLEQKHINGETIFGSVEIIGTKENENIIKYLDGYKEKGRIPTEFRYSGFAILGVEPSDDTARLIEINSRKENSDMDEFKEILAEIKSRIDKSEEYKKSLEKNEKEMETIVADKEELLKQIEDLKAENAELSKKLQDYETNSNSMKEELDDLKACSLRNDLNSALADFNDAQRAFAKEAIDEFSKDPLNSTNTIQDIVNSILWNIGKETCELEKKKVSEQNSKQNIEQKNDIFGEVIETSYSSEEISIF